MTTTPAQRAALARYDARRPAPLSVRLNAAQLAWIDGQRAPRESRAQCLVRLAGVPRSAGKPTP